MEKILIQFVRENELLYDKNHPNFKRIDRKNEIWKNIASEMNLSVIEVKRRWRTLRDKFNRETKEMRIAKQNGEVYSKKKWKYYDQMLFLIDVRQGNKETNSIQINQNLEFLCDYGEDDDDDDDERQLIDNYEEPIDIDTDVNLLRQLRDDIQNTQKEIEDFVKTGKTFYHKMTPVTTFFDSMALLVESKNLSLNNFIQLQVKVMKTVHEMILKQDEENLINEQ